MPPTPAPLPPIAAAGLVFFASGAVLVLEILAVRLLAPYVGLTIEAYTVIIGVILAGIAVGSWLGGRLADSVSPRRLLGPLLAGGGVLAIASVPAVRGLGELAEGGSDESALLITLVAFLPAAAVLSAVTPTVAKLQLATLAATGSVVGRLSAWATAGALTGTFATGFVLVPLLSTQVTVLAIGGLLIAVGLYLGVRLGRVTSTAVTAVLLLAAGFGSAGVLAGTPCDRESPYYCAQVEMDPERESGRLLLLDDLRHSYVDLDDPTHLEFAYTRWIAAAIDQLEPAGDPVDAVFVGGGGFTLPRWLIETRPGSHATVLEVDPGVVDLARDELGLLTGDDLRVRVGDGRVSLRALPAASADVVVGDAFSSLSVPWHLTTRELLGEVARVLRPGGSYVLNLIDYGSFDLARAEAATLLDAFDEVAIIGDPGAGPGALAGGNLVMVAADRPLDLAATEGTAGTAILDTRGVRAFARGADVLRDDAAPADQLLGSPGAG